ncbi:hypothetical protein D9615_009752 [Tricholomella constricta]|uniref:Uncharacterized protein n=1 Tax=Tricholomella constricta TaxID=117010 RepID=A0A8H5GST7_9AGAR|nr:hypothetical protein D9615_009752 [Tricholomella constricta]
MSFKRHHHRREKAPPPHPFLSQDPHSQMVRLLNDDAGLQFEIHPHHAALILAYDRAVCNGTASFLNAPLGTIAFARAFNRTDYRYKMCEFDETTQEWTVPRPEIQVPDIRKFTYYLSDFNHLTLLEMSLVDLPALCHLILETLEYSKSPSQL